MLSNKNLPQWKIKFGELLIAHNNHHAESPFAVAKWLARIYQSLGLDNISGTVSAIKNHTHCSELTNSKGQVTRKAGAAFIADVAVKEAVSELAHKNSAYCKERKDGKAKSRTNADKNHKERRVKAQLDQQSKRAKRMDTQNTFSEVELWRSHEEMNNELKATISNQNNKEVKLKNQIKARVDGRGFKYTNLPTEFLCKSGVQKVKLTPSGSQ